MQKLGILNYTCFVGDTQVVIREADNVAMAAAGMDDGERQSGFDASLILIAGMTITASWLGKETLDQRQRRGQKKSKPEHAREYDVDDPNRRELDLANASTESFPASTLSTKEFDMLCDDLLSGEVDSPNAVPRPSGSGPVGEQRGRSLTVAVRNRSDVPITGELGEEVWHDAPRRRSIVLTPTACDAERRTTIASPSSDAGVADHAPPRGFRQTLCGQHVGKRQLVRLQRRSTDTLKCSARFPARCVKRHETFLGPASTLTSKKGLTLSGP